MMDLEPLPPLTAAKPAVGAAAASAPRYVTGGAADEVQPVSNRCPGLKSPKFGWVC